jgi:hypothetical protein
MKVCIRLVAGLALILGTAGLLLSVAGGIGVWVVKGPVTVRATETFGRIDAALDVVEQNLGHVKAALARAAERLDTAKEEQRKLAQESKKNSAVGRVLARTIQQKVAPEVGDAHQKLHNVAEAAVVVNSVLEDLGNLPLVSASGLDLGRLEEINRRLADVGPAAWELSRLVGESGPESDAAGAEMSRVERALQTMQGLVAEYEPRVREVRRRAEELKSETLTWITPVAAIASLVCFWIALSQVSILVHAWSWWKHAGQVS